MPATTERGAAVNWILVWAALFAVVALVGSLLITHPSLSLFYLRAQDRWLIVAGAAALYLTAFRLRERTSAFDPSWKLALVIGTVMAAGSFAGHFLVLQGYDLSRDEQMATFDAAIFAKGQLTAPLHAPWQEFGKALNTAFMYPAEHRMAWASNYLPVNAAFRAALGAVATPALTGPAMAFVGAIALWGCIRRIWPESREPAAVGLLLYLGSGQIWLNSMSSYAMPAHLTLNLCWLWLFLRRRWWADSAALGVGLLAVGLHQPHYHPIFAAPILFLLVLERDWRRVSLYLIGYAAIMLFWRGWTSAIASLVVGDVDIAISAGPNYLVGLYNNLTRIDGLRFSYMFANIIRQVAWEHLLLVPLMVLGVKAAYRDRFAVALMAGIALTLIVRFVILPFQGHGIGYRYTHGLIGSFILLAVYGWQAIGNRKGFWRTWLLRTTAASCIMILSLQAAMTHAFYSAFSRVSARISATGADYAVLGHDDAVYAADLVNNDPYLSNRPVRLIRALLSPPLQTRICADRPTLVLIGSSALRPIADYFGVPVSAKADIENQVIGAELSRRGCRVSYL